MTNDTAHRIAALAVAYYAARRDLLTAENAWQPGCLQALRDAHGTHDTARLELFEMLRLVTMHPELVAGVDPSVDGTLADLRRLYHHIHAGGSVRREDAERISRGIAALEGAQAKQHAMVAA